MKRFASTLISVVMCAFLILPCLFMSGCHGKGTSERTFTVPEEFDSSRNYEITFWAKNDTNKTQTEVYDKAIKDFKELYPNITVTMKLYTDYSKIYNDVITNISTNTTPNVCITYPDHIATYLTGADTVADLGPLMENEKYGLGGSDLYFDSVSRDQIVEEYLNECKINDSYYALPFLRSTEACYINEDYVKALGYEVPDMLTWDFIWEVSEKALATNSDGSYVLNGKNVMIPFIYKSTDNMMITMLKQLDAGYSTEDGEVLIFNDTTKELLKEIALHGKSGAFSTFKISSYPANFLNAGECVFAIDSTAGSTWMGGDAPLVDISEEDLCDFNTVVRPVPQYDSENIYMMSQGPSICVFNKDDDQEVLASWLFAQYLLTNEPQISYAETEGYVPVTIKARESAEYLEYLNHEGDSKDHYQVKLDATKLLLENTENTFTTPVFNGSASLRSAASALIEETTKAVRRKKEIDDSFLNELFASQTSLHHLDEIEAESSDGAVRKDLGPLPSTAKWLLSGLALAWIFIIFVYLRRKLLKD